MRVMKDQKKIMAFMIRSEFRTMLASVGASLTLLLMFVHVLACIWYGIRIGRRSSYATPDEFIAVDDDLASSYAKAFHFSLALFMGEHVTQPRSIIERVFTISVLFIAFVVSAWFVGSLTTAMTRLQIIASQRSASLAVLGNYLSDNGISRELSLRAQRNAMHALDEEKRNTPEQNVKLLGIISDQIKAEIHYELYSPDMKAHTFFSALNDTHLICVRSLCHSCVSWESLSRGDHLFNEYDVPTTPSMFFVNSGYLRYFHRNDAQPEVVNTKQCFSEAALWTTWVHRGTMQAVKECRLLRVDAESVTRVVTVHKASAHFIAKYAAKFVKEMNTIEEDEITDLCRDAMVSGVTEKVLAETQDRRDSGASVVSRRRGSLTNLAVEGKRRISFAGGL
jgi:hypothetical protein